MDEQKRVRIPYLPRAQFKRFHARKQRWAVLVCHRRAGKTVATLNDLLRGAVEDGTLEGRYAFVFPQRNQAKDTAWRYLRRYAEPLLAKPPNESELRVDLVNGAMIRLYGADNPDALRGPYLDGVVLDEFADMKPEVWYEVVRPMLADRQGWATFIGTPRGKNEFWRLYNEAKKNPDWFHMMLKANESGLISKDELVDLRKEMGEDQFSQEFLCSFEAAIKGAFYAEELRAMQAEGRICPIKIDNSVRVHTAWDLHDAQDQTSWPSQRLYRLHAQSDRLQPDPHSQTADGVGQRLFTTSRPPQNPRQKDGQCTNLWVLQQTARANYAAAWRSAVS